MSRVEVCWQGKAILSGPSDYWTSVINAGRQCSLEAIRGSLPEGENFDGASQVVAAIMHLADSLALVGGNESETVFSSSSSSKNLQKLAVEHLARCGMQAPNLRCSELSPLRLRAAGEGLEIDNQILLTDKDMDLNRKVKKAFCEPGNAEFCPPINWVEALLPSQGEFVVARKEESGGDLRYSEIEALTKDFASEELHPGDLKPSLAVFLKSAMAPVQAGLKESKDLKKAEQKLAQYIKKSRKKK